jgi:hypothetical protein
VDKPFYWLSLLTLAVTPIAAWSQDLPSQPKPEGTVCVASVSNLSTRPSMLDRLAERLSSDLREDKIEVLTMESATTTDHKLHPTTENGEEAKSSNCDYILLTQILDPKTVSPVPQSTQISIGGKVPSIDASDPLGGSSGPVHRDNVQISFALFPVERLKPVLDTVMLAQPSGSASDNLLPAMDREASRVSRELKKK